MNLLETRSVIPPGPWIMQLGDKEIDWNEMNAELGGRISDKARALRAERQLSPGKGPLEGQRSHL